MSHVRRAFACVRRARRHPLVRIRTRTGGARGESRQRRRGRGRGLLVEDPAARRWRLRARLPRIRDARRDARHRRAGADRHDVEHGRGARRGPGGQVRWIRSDAPRLPRTRHRGDRGGRKRGQDHRAHDRAPRARSEELRELRRRPRRARGPGGAHGWMRGLVRRRDQQPLLHPAGREAGVWIDRAGGPRRRAGTAAVRRQLGRLPGRRARHGHHGGGRRDAHRRWRRRDRPCGARRARRSSLPTSRPTARGRPSGPTTRTRRRW